MNRKEKRLKEETRIEEKERAWNQKRFSTPKADQIKGKYETKTNEELYAETKKVTVNDVFFVATYVIAILVELFGLFLYSLNFFTPTMCVCTFAPLVYIYLINVLKDKGYISAADFELERREFQAAGN